jgi:Holliday junction resolvasome RuvABC endonuclease subunit
MIIATIDPSMSHTAVVVFDVNPDTLVAKVIHSDTINTEKGKNKQVRASSDAISRCRSLYEGTQDILSQYNPDLVFAETPTGSQSANGMKSYGIACFLLATISPAPIEVTPTEVKKASVGTKTASKAEMIAWAFEKHPELQWKLDKSGSPQITTEEHKADAVAVLYAGMKTPDFNRIIGVYRSK